MRPSNPAATAAYLAARADVRALLPLLASLVDAHADPDRADHGHVGDLGHVRGLLSEAARHLLSVQLPEIDPAGALEIARGVAAAPHSLAHLRRALPPG